jgi:cytochrome c peroxidase
MRKKTLVFGLLVGIIGAGISCHRDKDLGLLYPDNPPNSLDTVAYNPTYYSLPTIKGLPNMEVPASNPLTVEGIRLGRLLFYDPLLSRDSTLSCASCHKVQKAFTDGLPQAVGLRGIPTGRNSMSLINIGYFSKNNRNTNFNWDGKFKTLEDQVLAPVEHPLEMDNTWGNVIGKLNQHPHYPRLFKKAFGIESPNQVTKELAAKALAQFLRTLNSAGSYFDRTLWEPGIELDPQQQRGFDLFMGEVNGNPSARTAECGHCHGFIRQRVLFGNGNFSNNGLDSANTYSDFVDKGLGAITGRVPENGRFREVSLRNIALTAPYMHDGRFATLEEVLTHYVSGIKGSPNLALDIKTSPTLHTLTTNEKSDIVAFLHTLTDSSYFNKPEWQNPFSQTPNPWE